MALWLMGVFVREVPLRAGGGGADRRRLDAGAAVARRAAADRARACRDLRILTFVFSWNEFAVALNLTMKQTATVPVAIAKFAQDFEIRYTQMAAAAALSILPALVLLIIGQRYIVRG